MDIGEGIKKSAAYSFGFALAVGGKLLQPAIGRPPAVRTETEHEWDQQHAALNKAYQVLTEPKGDAEKHLAAAAVPQDSLPELVAVKGFMEDEATVTDSSEDTDVFAPPDEQRIQRLLCRVTHAEIMLGELPPPAPKS